MEKTCQTQWRSEKGPALTGGRDKAADRVPRGKEGKRQLEYQGNWQEKQLSGHPGTGGREGAAGEWGLVEWKVIAEHTGRTDRKSSCQGIRERMKEKEPPARLKTIRRKHLEREQKGKAGGPSRIRPVKAGMPDATASGLSPQAGPQGAGLDLDCWELKFIGKRR